MKTDIEKLVIKHCAKSVFLHQSCEEIVNAIHSVATDPEIAETMGLLEDGKYVTGKIIKNPGYSYTWNITWGTEPIKDTTLGWYDALTKSQHPTKAQWSFGKGLIVFKVGRVVMIRAYGNGYLPKVIIEHDDKVLEIPEGSHLRPFYRYWNRLVAEIFEVPLEVTKGKANRELRKCRTKIGDLTSGFYKLMTEHEVEAFRQQLRSCVSFHNKTLTLESGNLRITITEDSFAVKRCVSLRPLKWVELDLNNTTQFTRAIAYAVINMLEEQNILRKY